MGGKITVGGLYIVYYTPVHFFHELQGISWAKNKYLKYYQKWTKYETVEIRKKHYVETFKRSEQ